MAALSDLSTFLVAQRRTSWIWGVSDCTMWVADWVKLRSGRDPAEPFRGAYSNAEECHDMLRREGGFMPVIGWRMDELGFERTLAPADGDVGIVTAPISLQGALPVVGTICGLSQGGRWWCRGTRGLHHVDLPLITAWKV